MSDKELMDAMNAGIDAAAGKAPEETSDDAEADTTDTAAADQPGSAAAEEAAGDDSAGAGAPADGGEAGDDAAAAARETAGAEPGARERDPATGKFVKRGEGKAPAADGADEGKGAATAKPGIAAKPGTPKPADPVNDPIPEDVKGKTRERMVGLVNAAKTLTTERDTIKQERDELLGIIADTGATPETFWRHTEVLRLMMSDDPNEQRTAIKQLRGAADKIAAGLGDAVPGHDPLKDPANKDLADEVESGDLSLERARELAQARSREAAQTRRATESNQQERAQTEIAAARAAAITELNELGVELKKADPTGYARKTAILEDAARTMAETLPPAKWAKAYRAMYDKLGKVPASATNGARAPRGTGANQPARPTQGAGGGGPRVPQSAEEALDLGIAAAATVQR